MALLKPINLKEKAKLNLKPASSTKAPSKRESITEMVSSGTMMLKSIGGSSRTASTKAMENTRGKTEVSTMEGIWQIKEV